MTWVQTYQGGFFDLLNPKPEMVNFRTVARALARTPRFVTHTNGQLPYSVGQHSIVGCDVILAQKKRPDLALAFLLHDAHEYVFGDVVSPVSEAIAQRSGCADAVRAGIADLKRGIDGAILLAAGLPADWLDQFRPIVHLCDLAMCRTEWKYLLDEPPIPLRAAVANAPVLDDFAPQIAPPWPSTVVEFEWLLRFESLRALTVSGNAGILQAAE